MASRNRGGKKPTRGSWKKIILDIDFEEKVFGKW